MRVGKRKSHVRFFKVGLQLFIADWWRGIDVVLQNDCKVMVDLKLFDIPETFPLAVDKLKNKGGDLYHRSWQRSHRSRGRRRQKRCEGSCGDRTDELRRE